MPLQFEGEVRIRVDDTEAVVKGRDDVIYIEGPLLRLQGVGPKMELGPLAKMADRLGLTLCFALPGGFEMRLGRKAKRSGWVSRLVDGPASVGRA